MKTIEQHLQELFVGKRVNTSCVDFVRGKEIKEEFEGVVEYLEIIRNEFIPDYFQFNFVGTNEYVMIHPEVDTIEIL